MHMHMHMRMHVHVHVHMRMGMHMHTALIFHIQVSYEIPHEFVLADKKVVEVSSRC